MHYFRAIQVPNNTVVQCRPVSFCRMCCDGETALAMNVVDNLRSRLSPADVLVYSNCDYMKARCCNLFANKNCRPSHESGIPSTSLGREDPVVVRDCNGVQPLMTRTGNKDERRKHAVRQEAVHMKIRFDNLITAALHHRSFWYTICERPPNQSDYQ